MVGKIGQDEHMCAFVRRSDEGNGERPFRTFEGNSWPGCFERPNMGISEKLNFGAQEWRWRAADYSGGKDECGRAFGCTSEAIGGGEDTFGLYESSSSRIANRTGGPGPQGRARRGEARQGKARTGQRVGNSEVTE